MFLIAHKKQLRMNKAIELNKNISSLLKKISEVLSVLSIDELNQAIGEILLNNEKDNDNIQKLTNIVCVEYNVASKSLYEKYSRNEIYQAKITLYVLIHKHLGVSKRKISKQFRTYPNSVNVAISHFDKLMPDKFKADKDFLEKYKLCLSKFLEQVTNE